MTYVQSGTQTETDLKHTQLAETTCTVRVKVTCRIVQKGDIVTVEKAKERIRLRTRREQESWEKKEYSRRQYPKRKRLKFVRFYRTISAMARLRIASMNPEDQLEYQLSDEGGQ